MATGQVLYGDADLSEDPQDVGRASLQDEWTLLPTSEGFLLR